MGQRYFDRRLVPVQRARGPLPPSAARAVAESPQVQWRTLPGEIEEKGLTGPFERLPTQAAEGIPWLATAQGANSLPATRGGLATNAAPYVSPYPSTMRLLPGEAPAQSHSWIQAPAAPVWKTLPGEEAPVTRPPLQVHPGMEAREMRYLPGEVVPGQVSEVPGYIYDQQPLVLNVKTFGAIGERIALSGTISQNSNRLKLLGLKARDAVRDPVDLGGTDRSQGGEEGGFHIGQSKPKRPQDRDVESIIYDSEFSKWKIGSGVGVAQAGPGGSSLRAQVVGLDIANYELTLSIAASASVRGATVWNDDSLPIQDALSSAGNLKGADVYVPAGLYPIGVPDATSNAPLIIHTQTRVRGDGVGKTRLRLADRAAQRHPTKKWNITGEVLLEAGMFVNRASQTRPGLQNIAPDREIRLAEMTLNGNRDGQPVHYNGGGDPTVWSDDPNGFRAHRNSLGFDLIDSPQAALELVPWVFFVAYLDKQGNESTVSNSVALLPLAGKAAALLLPVARNANAPLDRDVIVYFKRNKKKYATVESWLGISDYRRLLFPRGSIQNNTVILDAKNAQDPDDIPAEIAPLPAPAKGRYAPPGAGITPRGHASSGGIQFDNAENCDLENLEVHDFASDGLDLSSSATDDPKVSFVKRAKLTNVESHHNGRHGMAIPGQIYSARVIASRLSDNGSTGCDIEGHFSRNQALFATDIEFLGTYIARNGIGIAINNPTSYGAIQVRLAERCVLDENTVHLRITNNAAPSSAFDLDAEDTTFKNSLQEACLISTNFGVTPKQPGGFVPAGHVRGRFLRCFFLQNGRPRLLSPDWNWNGGSQASQILFNGTGTYDWSIGDGDPKNGCVFVMYGQRVITLPHEPLKSDQGAIVVQPQFHGLRVLANKFDGNRTDPSVFVKVPGKTRDSRDIQVVGNTMLRGVIDVELLTNF